MKDFRKVDVVLRSVFKSGLMGWKGKVKRIQRRAAGERADRKWDRSGGSKQLGGTRMQWQRANLIDAMASTECHGKPSHGFTTAYHQVSRKKTTGVEFVEVRNRCRLHYSRMIARK
jgi:hypothetical protein